MPYDDLPELAGLDSTAGVRIPPDVTVPLSPRVRRLLDAPPLRRLARISQLGLVALVYPGAVHSRLEHSLGVYRLALEFLARLRHDGAFHATIDRDDAAAFLVAALVHDIGHWPFCHPLEDMGLAELPRHEDLAGARLTTAATATLLRDDWGLDPARVAALVAGSATDPAGRMIGTLLSGPIDVDKMDYLARDSLHAGVPYGRHFDQPRLLSGLCIDDAGRLAITDKGRTAAELMVFARYVMFSEVYWHHAVRAATAMLQRAVWILRARLDIGLITTATDADFVSWLETTASGTPAAPLVDGLFGPARRLHKRVAVFDAVECPAVHAALAGQPYPALVAASQRLARRLEAELGSPIADHDLLIDAPPVHREVEFNLAVRTTMGEPRYRPLASQSPVVRALAREQFDSLVKRVRLFASRPLAERLAGRTDLAERLLEAASPG
jgi:hypothetical protein